VFGRPESPQNSGAALAALFVDIDGSGSRSCVFSIPLKSIMNLFQARVVLAVACIPVGNPVESVAVFPQQQTRMDPDSL
jgi:hypothetical protein